ncbi:MAG: hypothetical protein ABH846_00075 [Patescibacteria group bacterium]
MTFPDLFSKLIIWLKIFGGIMPVLYISGMPDTVPQTLLVHLIETLQLDVASFDILGITKNQVSIFFPTDLVKRGLGEELIVRLLLTKKDDRSPAVRRELAQLICDRLKSFVRLNVPQCELIEVLPEEYDEAKQGFACWRKPEGEGGFYDDPRRDRLEPTDDSRD